MSGAVTYTGNGMFSVTMNGKTETLNMADLNAMLRMEQVEGYDQTIADQLAEIRSTNEKRKNLNLLLSSYRKIKANRTYATADPARSASRNADKLTLTVNGKTETKDPEEWMKEFGIEYGDSSKTGSKYDAEMDRSISNLKSRIDNITSDSEMQMLRFRQMVDKRGTALQEAKTTLSNDKRLKDAIVQG